ncbi:MAG: hypothetical protein WC547_08490 [Candidatus Omnitrophota bacterium]
MSASEAMQRWSKPSVTLQQVSIPDPETFLKNYMAARQQNKTVVPVPVNPPATDIPVGRPAIVAPAVIPVAPVNGYLPAVLPRVDMANGGEWQYSSGVVSAVVSMVRSGSRYFLGRRISFSAGGYDFSGTVMAAKPNEMAVKADNGAWFGLIATSSRDSITVIAHALVDEGTADLSGIEVLNNGMTLRISGFDPDGTPGTVDFDIVGDKQVSEDLSASQLVSLCLTSGGVIYELVSNAAGGFNLARVNGISYEGGAIVFAD